MCSISACVHITCLYAELQTCLWWHRSFPSGLCLPCPLCVASIARQKDNIYIFLYIYIYINIYIWCQMHTYISYNINIQTKYILFFIYIIKYIYTFYGGIDHLRSMSTLCSKHSVGGYIYIYVYTYIYSRWVHIHICLVKFFLYISNVYLSLQIS